jgi:1,4-alpha-glucan branching enzyme
MLYRDYSRKHDEWIPNRYGGRENEEAIGFMKELNDTVREAHPEALVLAEESTAWPGVTGSTHAGGLGFSHKWNMGWMHDTLEYFSVDPLFRKHHHHQLTFGLLYAFSEHFVLPLSHDEVVHGKRSLLEKMPGDDWQKFANLRALYGWMWAHPGKKLLFMGSEFGQRREWNHDESLDWHLAQMPPHRGLMTMVSELNRVMRSEPALHSLDFSSAGFEWVQADQSQLNVYAFVRHAPGARPVLAVTNLSPMVRADYRVGVPRPGHWKVLFDSDGRKFGGAGIDVAETSADPIPWDGKPFSFSLTLPPLASVWLAP